MLVVVGTIFQFPICSFFGCEMVETLSQNGCEKAKTLSQTGCEKAKTLSQKRYEKAKTIVQGLRKVVRISLSFFTLLTIDCQPKGALWAFRLGFWEQKLIK